jgi:hypothetical protein
MNDRFTEERISNAALAELLDEYLPGSTGYIVLSELQQRRSLEPSAEQAVSASPGNPAPELRQVWVRHIPFMLSPIVVEEIEKLRGEAKVLREDNAAHVARCYVAEAKAAEPSAEQERLRAGLQLIADDKHRLMNESARQTAASILGGKPIGDESGAEPAWQPIETAPDGATVLVAHFSDGRFCWAQAAKRGAGRCRLLWFTPNGKSTGDPTHWRLPPSFTSTKDAGHAD